MQINLWPARKSRWCGLLLLASTVGAGQFIVGCQAPKQGLAPVLDETVPWNDIQCQYARVNADRGWRCDVKAGNQELLEE